MQDKAKEKKIVIWGSIILVAIIILGLIIPHLFTSDQPDDGALSAEQTTNMTFENSYELLYSIGDSCTTEALNQIRSLLEKDVNISSVAVIDEASFSKISISPEVYSFIISIDSNETYRAYVRIDDEQSDDDFLHTMSVSTYIKTTDDATTGLFKTSAIGSDLKQQLSEWTKNL